MKCGKRVTLLILATVLLPLCMPCCGRDLQRGISKRPTYMLNAHPGPVWTPSGRQIVFNVFYGGSQGSAEARYLYMVELDGSGIVRYLTRLRTIHGMRISLPTSVPTARGSRSSRPGTASRISQPRNRVIST